MKKILILMLVASSLVFTGCTGKDKKDSVGVGDVGNDSSIGVKDMSFDTLGSDSGKIDGLNSVAFSYDESRLSASAKKLLADNADWIKSRSGVTVQIEGHCDSRGSVEYNLALGEKRAKAVKNYLVNLGVPSSQMTIISYGKEKPLMEGDSLGVFSKNRRANFVPLSGN